MRHQNKTGTDLATSTQTIEGVTFAVADGEPKARDLDIAVKLGYERPRKIRDLIERWAQDLGPLDMRPTVGRIKLRPGVTRPATGEEAWLTEAQALFIAAKSDTPAAANVLREIIHVFMLARKGLLPAAGADTQTVELLARVVDSLATMQARIEALEARPAGNTNGPALGPGGARALVLDPLREVARIEAGALKQGDKASLRSLRQIAENNLRERLAFHRGGGQAWAAFPQARLGELQLVPGAK